jgi:hypothetical protein
LQFDNHAINEGIMIRLLAQFGVTAHLGRCMFCMRAAFLTTVSMWLLVLVALALTSRIGFIAPLVATATAFSVLWLVHLAAYAERVVQHQGIAAIRDLDGFATKRNRRELFRIFAKAFAAVAVTTMLPALWAGVRAQGSCPSNTPVPCGTQYCCAGSALYFCSGYRGNTSNWRQMGTFCTNANTNEDVADLRSNCAIFVQC